MKIITQDGTEIENVLEVEKGSRVIYAGDVLLGKYTSGRRTIWVFSELSALLFNDKNAIYIMPQE